MKRCGSGREGSFACVTQRIVNRDAAEHVKAPFAYGVKQADEGRVGYMHFGEFSGAHVPGEDSRIGGEELGNLCVHDDAVVNPENGYRRFDSRRS